MLPTLFVSLLGCPITDDVVVEPPDPVACAAVDADEDGVDSCTDCRDDDPLVYPGAAERCNGIDDNCDDVLGWGEDDLSCESCEAAGYWSILDGLSGKGLEDAINETLGDQRCDDYGDATDFLFLNLDKEDGAVACVYTGRTTSVGSDKPDGNDMNTEHTWPQSLGAGSNPARCDLAHLFPTDADANNKRGSLPFGIVSGGTSWSEGGSVVGTDAAGVEVFEPRDAHKGDAARAILYFAIRYRERLDASEVEAMLGNGREEMLREWARADPPSDDDIARALKIGQFQGWTNPLVVCPSAIDAL